MWNRFEIVLKFLSYYYWLPQFHCTKCLPLHYNVNKWYFKIKKIVLYYNIVTALHYLMWVLMNGTKTCCKFIFNYHNFWYTFIIIILIFNLAQLNWAFLFISKIAFQFHNFIAFLIFNIQKSVFISFSFSWNSSCTI